MRASSEASSSPSKMGRTSPRTVKTAPSSSSPSKKTSSGFGDWPKFYAEESARLKEKYPGMKGTTLKKRCSSAWKKKKAEEKKAEAAGEEE
ncbi:hypothetical protein JCM10213v2_003485 [Rhodosporidiobolus nylandii]